ncbi:interleukin-6 receptor subunit alpha [Megalops cyprinoides]|uniref:interleukin-6 receptor subunit alpha n=1 Tax=Megalops cyprinoides TaxID=118141 RepID=UPI0018654C26|nr:interleukin-6 receptor subunit alpha [Megalops cyprinoides]
MCIWTTLTLLLSILVVIDVQSFQERKCPKKDPPPGVLVLAPGKELTLSCSGRITVNGVDITESSGVPRGREERDNHPSPTGVWRGEEHRGERPDRAESVTVSHAGLADRPDHSSQKGETVNVTSEDGGVTLNRGLNGTQVKAAHSFEGAAVNGHASGVDGVHDEGVGPAERMQRGLRVQWKVNGSVRPAEVDGGDTLHLSALRLSDTGVYSCHQGRKQAFSVRITVAKPPERPTLTCLRKTPTSKIRCDWTSAQSINPTPQCYLILKKGLQGQLSTLNCSYSVSRARCWCALDHPEGDRNTYLASLCVTNTAGNVTSPLTEIHPLDIIKPDPPRNISVRGEEGKTHRLRVTWNNPISWRADFYRLRFHLQYAPVLQGKPKNEKQDVFIEGLSFTIRDALPHTKYLLQMRAREEFNTGQWSDWSPAVYAYTWADPEPSTTSVIASIFDLDPLSEGSGMPPDDQLSASVTQSPINPTWLHLSWVFGACTILLLTALAVYILRHRERFISKLHKLGQRSASHTPAPPPSQLPQEEGNPLVSQEPSSPSQHQDTPFLQEGEERGEGIHLNNIGYFLVQRN